MASPFTPRALEPRWLTLIDEVAARVLGPHDRRGRALAAEVRALSLAYTGRDASAPDAQKAGASMPAARMRFYLPRDLPKIEGPLAELGHLGALPDVPRWRVLDLGAGYGTTSLGIARLAQRLGMEGIDVVAVERDAAALDGFAALSTAAAREGLIAPITLEVVRSDATARGAQNHRCDLVAFGLSLGEMFRAEPDRDAREAAREQLVRSYASGLAEGGALIVLEPALRASARALSRMRDRIAADPGDDALRVVAPCTHDGPCPMLARERDWCHAELAMELAPELAKIAEAAELRRSRLTYSYLALTRGAQPPQGDVRWRIVAGPVASKGKREWDACGGTSDATGLVRLRRLERDMKKHPIALDTARRGALARLGEAARVGESLRVRSDDDCSIETEGSIVAAVRG
ncbi:MAG: small ribosomal subunit Rsm22 family protein [Sandaracinaceae bacterium]